jgi:hypothetical protein
LIENAEDRSVELLSVYNLAMPAVRQSGPVSQLPAWLLPVSAGVVLFIVIVAFLLAAGTTGKEATVDFFKGVLTLSAKRKQKED